LQTSLNEERGKKRDRETTTPAGGPMEQPGSKIPMIEYPVRRGNDKRDYRQPQRRKGSELANFSIGRNIS